MNLFSFNINKDIIYIPFGVKAVSNSNHSLYGEVLGTDTLVISSYVRFYSYYVTWHIL